MCYNIRKRKEGLFRREPGERAHREIIVFSVPDGKLFLEVVEGKELVGSIEVFVIFAVAALYFTVMSGRIRFNELVLNTKPLQSYLKERLFV